MSSPTRAAGLAEVLVLSALGLAAVGLAPACRKRGGATMTPGGAASDPRARAYRVALAAQARMVLSEIRIRQESYRAEFATYCDVSSTLHDGSGTSPAVPWPRGEPGVTPVAWDPAPGEWSQLGVRITDPVYFRYEVVAGRAGVAPPAGSGIPAGDAWWIARAYGDLDGDGVRTTFEATSTRTELRVTPAGAE